MPEEKKDIPTETESGEAYTTTPEKATSFKKKSETPGTFNRRRVLMTISISLGLVVGIALIMNLNRTNKAGTAETGGPSPGGPPPGFLQSQFDRSQREAVQANETEEEIIAQPVQLPAVAWDEGAAAYPMRYTAPPPVQQAPPRPQGNTQTQLPTHFTSPLMPAVEGSLLAASTDANQGVQVPDGNDAMNAYLQYLAQSGATTQNTNSSGDGFTIQDNTIWIGTIIPGVLLTGINTDLPGNVLARVSENVFDSKTGQMLLIPQGSILFARYNNSISYAQKRVQIAWDTLIRPDGFQVELGGMGGVDRRGMSGQEAVYHENWFEYLKAAGIIGVFSIANAKMAEEAGKHTSDAIAGAIAQSNAEFMSQVGGAVISRVMDIQPTLTVDSGTIINIMVNRNLAIPPLPNYPVRERYRR